MILITHLLREEMALVLGARTGPGRNDKVWKRLKPDSEIVLVWCDHSGALEDWDCGCGVFSSCDACGCGAYCDNCEYALTPIQKEKGVTHGYTIKEWNEWARERWNKCKGTKISCN